MPIATLKVTIALAMMLAASVFTGLSLSQSVYASNGEPVLTSLETHCGKAKHKPEKPYNSMADEEEGTPDPEATFPAD